MAKWTSGQSVMSQPTMFEDSSSAISSPASEAGRTLFDSPDGLTTEKSGPGVVPVSRSRQRAPKLGETIRATFGRRGFASSASADLTSSLVSRLKQRLPTAGSTLFQTIWKEKATPSGRSVCLLRASGHRTSGNGSGSWPSPMAGTPSQKGYNEAGSTDFERKVDTLMGTREHPNGPKLASWPTPRNEDSESTGAHRGTPDTLTSASRLTSWASPSARDWKDTPGMSETGVNPDGSERTRLDQLPRQAALASWATLNCMDHLTSGNLEQRKTKGGCVN